MIPPIEYTVKVINLFNEITVHYIKIRTNASEISYVHFTLNYGYTLLTILSKLWLPLVTIYYTILWRVKRASVGGDDFILTF